jgi:hypothetical protein
MAVLAVKKGVICGNSVNKFRQGSLVAFFDMLYILIKRIEIVLFQDFLQTPDYQTLFGVSKIYSEISIDKFGNPVKFFVGY